MSDASRRGRTYNEKEIGQLIRRASRLHEDSADSGERQLSLAEVQVLAEELGLSPEHLQTAALELEDKDRTRRGVPWWGGPFRVDHHVSIPASLTEDQWASIVLEIEDSIGSAGRIRHIGAAREWTRYTGEGEGGANLETTQVTLQPHGSNTAVRIQKRFGGAAFFAYLAASLPAVSLAILLAGDPITAANGALLAGAVGLIPGMRALIGWASRRKKESFRALAERIQLIVTAGPARAVAEAGVEPAAGPTHAATAAKAPPAPEPTVSQPNPSPPVSLPEHVDSESPESTRKSIKKRV